MWENIIKQEEEHCDDYCYYESEIYDDEDDRPSIDDVINCNIAYNIFRESEDNKTYIHSDSTLNDIFYCRFDEVLLYSETLKFLEENIIELKFSDVEDFLYYVKQYIEYEFDKTKSKLKCIKEYLICNLEIDESIIYEYNLDKFTYSILYDDEYGVYLWLNSLYLSHLTSSNVSTGY